MTWEELRELLPAARSHRFLNYAATAPMLAPAADAMAAIARQGCEPMGEHFDQWLAVVEGTRRAVADLIHASPEEIAFVTNTSTALSLAAAAVRWKPGDRVLFPADEFPSNRYVWQNLADQGVVADALEPARGMPFAEQLARTDLTGLRLIAVSAVSYVDGRRADVADLAKWCRARGILLAVDAIQAVGAMPVDVRDWDCDFFACGGQKWLLGPSGSGFLHIAARRLPELRLPVVGWASSRAAGDFETTEFVPCDGARRFEPGLPDVAAIAGLGKSLECLAAAGWTTIHDRIAAHTMHLREGLRARGFEPLDDGEPGGIVSFEMTDEAALGAMLTACQSRRIVLTHRHRRVRVSAHAVTSEEDLEAFLATLGRGSTIVAATPRSNRRQAVAAGPEVRPLAVVTGAGRGLGEGIATALARRGFDLLLVGRDESALTEVSGHLARKHGCRAAWTRVDLGDPESLQAWLSTTGDLARASVLVNNAASANAGLFIAEEPGRIRRDFEVNTFAPMALARAVLPGMLERRHGAILNIVTSGARCALPLFSIYSSSKAALWAWSEALGHELSGTGVHVCTFLPPHMGTTTQRLLGRKALAYYRAGGHAGALATPAAVAESAVAAMVGERAAVTPLAVKLKLALHALCPALLARRIAARWRPNR